ncbi:MAG: hypothetical protein QM804_06050 [Propionicimonas sp.]
MAIADRLSRVAALVKSNAAGAMVAQVWQAGGSFALQILAAWTLGAVGLGVFALLYGIIVLVTAISSGMVGDSLIILNRADRAIRSGLQFWALALATAAFGVAAAVSYWTGLLPWQAAIWFGLATALFMVEELIRRLLMATMRFWHLVLVDGSALVACLATIGLVSLSHQLSIGTFLMGLCAGQAIGLLVGICALPKSERRLVRLQRDGIGRVAAFGAWRGAQVSIPQLVQTLSRTLVTVAVSAAALGEVEAARILVAPLTLLVQGFGSYLLSSYAKDRDLGPRKLRERAWKASATMMAGALVVGLVIVLLTPVVGPLVSGPAFAIDPVVVAGWMCYVIGMASLQPFGSLGAVLGQQGRLLLCRVFDVVAALATLFVLVVVFQLPATVMPFVLAAGLMVGGITIRYFVLRPLIATERVAEESAEVELQPVSGAR